MALDLTSFKKAVAALERALTEAHSSEFMDRLTQEQQEIIRSGVIQNFEFTYELCWKFMKRWLERNLGSTYVDGVSRRELFRLAAEYHLIHDVLVWFDYHEARDKTSQTYNKTTAMDVFNVATQFLNDAQGLLRALEERND